MTVTQELKTILTQAGIVARVRREQHAGMGASGFYGTGVSASADLPRDTTPEQIASLHAIARTRGPALTVSYVMGEYTVRLVGAR